MSMYIGEALAGEGNEVAHIDLLIGDKTGPVGIAFANALARQSEGHSNLLAVLTPNVLAKPATVVDVAMESDRTGQWTLTRALPMLGMLANTPRISFSNSSGMA